MKAFLIPLFLTNIKALSPRQLVVPELAGTVTTCDTCEEDTAQCITCDDVDCGESEPVPCAEIEDWVHENRKPDSTFLFETEGIQRYEYSCTACKEGTGKYQCTKCQTFPANHCVLPEVHKCGGGEELLG